MTNIDRRIKHICPECKQEFIQAEYIDGLNFKYICEQGHTTIMTRNDLEGKKHAQEFRKFDHKNIDKPDSEIGVDGWERWIK